MDLWPCCGITNFFSERVMTMDEVIYFRLFLASELQMTVVMCITYLAYYNLKKSFVLVKKVTD